MWYFLVFAMLVLLAGAGAATWWWLFRYSLPKTEGRIEVSGLSGPVDIVRDQWGVPHIQASSLFDALHGLGFAHGQDRLWQMEFQRRLGAGRLAEVLGGWAVSSDILMRRLGLHRAAVVEAEQLDPREREAVESYCRGINEWIAHVGKRLPVEFRLLKTKPEPWTPVDVLLRLKVMAIGSHNWEQEIIRYRLLQTLGPEQAARVEPHYPVDQPIIMAAGEAGASDPARKLLQLFEEAQPLISAAGGSGSNAWVVSGERTETKNPMLANDPHLSVRLPSVWYEAHVTCPEMDVVGATLPGFPGVIIGHNDKVGWGLTNSCADVADLFIERWNMEESAVEYEGRLEPVQVLEERIRVRGKPEVIERVFITRHGPILSGGPLGEGPAFALRWTGAEPGHPVRVVLAMNAAENAEEFRSALKDWAAPSQTVVFADKLGNIGSIMAGLLPIRKPGVGLTPVPGWIGDFEWRGWVSFSDLPQSFNPESGMIVAANHAVVDHDYPYYVSWDWANGYRAGRIEQLLRNTSACTIPYFEKMQMDVCTLAGQEFVEHCSRLRGADEHERKALDALLNWDGHLTTDSVGGAVYEVMLHACLTRAYGPLMGDQLLSEWMGKSIYSGLSNGHAGRATAVLLRELRRRDPGFFDYRKTVQQRRPSSQTYTDPWDELLAAGLSDAVQILRKKLGNDPANWRWGRIHRLRLAHPFAFVKRIGWLFPSKSLPIGGDTDTPLQTAFLPHNSFNVNLWAPCYRQILDFADLDRSVSVLPGGQSGHVHSAHSLDQLDDWYRGDYHPLAAQESSRRTGKRLVIGPVGFTHNPGSAVSIES